MGKRNKINKNNKKRKNNNNNQFTTKFRYFTRTILGSDSTQESDQKRVSHVPSSSSSKHQESNPSLEFKRAKSPKNELNDCSNHLQRIAGVKEKIEPLQIITIEDSPFTSIKNKSQLQSNSKNHFSRKQILQNTIRSIKRRNMVFSTPYQNKFKKRYSFGNISEIQRSNIKRTAGRAQSTSSSISSNNNKIATNNIETDTIIIIDDDEEDDGDEEDCILIEPEIVKIDLVDSIPSTCTEISVNEQTQNNERTTQNISLETVTSEDTFINYSNMPTVDRTDEREEGEIITLDGTLCDMTVVEKTLVNDITGLDFIPLEQNDANTNEKDRRKSATQNSYTPKPNQQAILQNSLFTRSEKKELIKYNSNAYNPNPEQIPKGKKRTIIIDGSNVAYSHGLSKFFSVKGLNICINFFIELGHNVKAVVPQFRLKSTQSDDPVLLERLFKSGIVIYTPCKNLPGRCVTSYDDRTILQLAAEIDGVVISNDNYRDLIMESVAFKKIIENRVIGYTWCDDIFILPKDPYGKFGPPLHAILNRL